MTTSLEKKIRRRTLTQEMEYEEAPSGFVKLYNYKEPFMKFKDGFGFQGVLLFDGSSDRIQCHLCGKWFDALSNHIYREHNMKVRDYKEQVGLLQSTALINEKVRAKLIATGTNRFNNLRKGKKKTRKEIEKTRATLKKNVLNRERQNMYGTCPAQLIERLKAEYEFLGFTPFHDSHATRLKPEYRESAHRVGDKSTYVAVFGSWENALKMANIPYRKPGQTTKVQTWNFDKAVSFFTHYLNAKGVMPSNKEIPKSLQNRFYGKNKINKKVVIKNAMLESSITKGEKGQMYDKEQLIKFLKNFKEVHGRPASYSDSKRGLIPHLSRYSYHFGSWKNAVKQAYGN